MIIRNRIYKQHTRRRSLLAFNQLSRRRLHKWMLSPDLRGQGQGRTHQRLIDLAIDSVQEDDYSGLSDLEADDNDQKNVNVIPPFEVQDDDMIEFMHNIKTMTFHDEVIRTNKQAGQIVPLRNIVRGPIEPTVPQFGSWANYLVSQSRNVSPLQNCLPKGF